MVRILAILMLCLPCYGQIAFTYTDQPFLQTETSGDTFPTLSFPVVARWDANASGTTDGEAIPTIVDVWNNKYHLITNKNASAIDAYWTNNASAINGNGWIQFSAASGGNWARTNISTAYNYPNVYFIVCKDINITTSGNNRMFCSGNSLFPHWSYNTGGSQWGFYSGVSLVWGAGEGPPASGSWQVYIFRQNGASSSAKAGSWAGVSGDIGAGNGTGMVVNAGNGNDFRGAMGLAYFVWVNGNLSGAEETNVVRWIADRFGVPSNYGP